MKFIFGLLIVAFLVFLLFGTVLGKIIRFFASSGGTNTNRQGNNRRANNNTSTAAPTAPKKFAKEEGEYVSYEEIKDEEVK